MDCIVRNYFCRLSFTRSAQLWKQVLPVSEDYIRSGNFDPSVLGKKFALKNFLFESTYNQLLKPEIDQSMKDLHSS